MKQIARLLREPLFHFFIIGGLLFALYAAVSGPSPAPVNRIVVAPERVTQLSAGHEAVWRRPPTDDELRALIDNFVREEVYSREALALGLDRDDAIIRRRLQQKMEFLTDSGADLIEPSAGELEAYYAANQEGLQDPPRMALEQVFLGQQPTQERVASVLDALHALKPGAEADPMRLGDRSFLPAKVALSTPAALDGIFGAGFFGELTHLPTDVWAGPVESGYGVHLIRISESVPGRVPPFEEVRNALLREWKSSQAMELREQNYARMRARYDVVLPSSVAPNRP